MLLTHLAFYKDLLKYWPSQGGEGHQTCGGHKRPYKSLNLCGENDKAFQGKVFNFALYFSTDGVRETKLDTNLLSKVCQKQVL